jgi:hypothetical protein
MNKLNTDARLPQGGDPALTRRLAELQRENASLVNALALGQIAGAVNAAASPPSTGTFAVGDFVRNSNPTEAGTAGSKYVVFGWIKLASGFVPMRFLTGN